MSSGPSPLRPYQLACLDAMMGDLQTEGSALGVLATGTGKTPVIASLAERIHATRGGRILALAQRQELLEQIERATGRWTGLTVGLEIADQRVDRENLPDLVVASVGSMQGKRLASWPRDAFSAVLVDEAHHAVAPGHRKVLDWFNEAWRAGFTATADRLDRVPLGRIFKRFSFTYDVRTAIGEGYLAPVRQQVVSVEGLDLSNVRKVSGEFSEKDLEKALAQEGPLHGMAVPTIELAKGRPGLVFAVTVEHAERLAVVMNAHKPGCAVVIHGGMKKPERAKVLREYSEGRVQFLVNVALLTEGVDLPRVSVVSMARPTLSRALYTQMVGRGTRLFEGKAHCLVIDFVGNSGRHKLITAMDVLGDTDDPQVRARAEQLMTADPTLHVIAALARAKELIAEERAAEIRKRAEEKKAREEAIRKAQEEANERVREAWRQQTLQLEEELRRAKRPEPIAPPRVAYTVRAVDPFAGPDGFLGARVTRDKVRASASPPTPGQLGVLERNGIDVAGLSKADASTIISAIFNRRDAGLCSVKQARLLSKFGLRTDVTRDEASALLDAVAGNGWRVPPTIEPKYRAAPSLTVIPGSKVA